MTRQVGESPKSSPGQFHVHDELPFMGPDPCRAAGRSRPLADALDASSSPGIPPADGVIAFATRMRMPRSGASSPERPRSAHRARVCSTFVRLSCKMRNAAASRAGLTASSPSMTTYASTPWPAARRSARSCATIRNEACVAPVSSSVSDRSPPTTSRTSSSRACACCAPRAPTLRVGGPPEPQQLRLECPRRKRHR